MRASQIYTARQQTVDDLVGLISLNSPRDVPPGIGYGAPAERGDIDYAADTGTFTIIPNGNRSGVFYDLSPADEAAGKLSQFYDHVHFRW